MTSMARRVLALTVAVGALTMTACSVAAQRRSAEPFIWEGRIPTGATVEVKGVNGPVRAIPASGTNVRVEVSRTGRRNDPEEVEIVVLEHSNGVTVCAVYPATMLRRNECAPGSEGRIGASNNDVQVAFTVEVPADVHLSARTANGSVRAENLTGDVEAISTNGEVRIEGGSRAVARTTNGAVTIDTNGTADARTTNGRITVRMGRLNENLPVRFSTTNGSITLSLPGDANAEVDMRTTNGSIQTDFPIAVQGQIGRRRVSGTIGSGGTRVELQTTNGGIRLQRSN